MAVCSSARLSILFLVSLARSLDLVLVNHAVYQMIGNVLFEERRINSVDRLQKLSILRMAAWREEANSEAFKGRD